MAILKYSTVSYSCVQAMIYAIEEINDNYSLLPNISLGYKIFDTCAHISRSLKATILTMTGQDHPILNYQCNKKVPLAIIGDATSGASIAMATLLGVYRHPQVSYSASVSSLSNRVLYPSFLRTIPNDAMQSRALAQLVSHMGWNWVGLLSLDNDDYGIVGSQLLKEELQIVGVCLAYHETFGKGSSPKKIQLISDIVVQSTARVVIIYSRDPFINPLVEVLVQRDNITRIWLATTAWSNSPVLAIKIFSHIMMGTIGLSLHEVDMPGFKEFLLDIRPSSSLPQDVFIEKFWELVQGCRWRKDIEKAENGTVWCTGQEKLERFKAKQYEFNEFDFRIQYLIYNAVYAVAHALHNLIFCVSGQDSFPHKVCSNPKTLKPWQVLPHLKKIYFMNRMGEEMYFDQEGNPPADFDILNWHRSSEGTIQFVKIGRYNVRAPPGKELSINVTAIQWNAGEVDVHNAQRVPRSVCSESCPPGFRKAAQKGQPICCFDCIQCSEGEISNRTDSSNCFPCTDETWPNEDNTRCLPKAVEFLSSVEPLGLTVITTITVCSFTTVTIMCIFIKYKDTAIVKANNRNLTYLLLCSLLLCFLCTLLFIGEPSRLTCIFHQMTFGVVFVLSISCILAKTLMVVIAFRATRPGSNMKKWLGPSVPSVTVFMFTLLQVFICTFWVVFCPPFPERNIKIKIEVIILQCDECSDVLLWCMFGYMGFLACVCFMVAFLARKLPDSFNEAKWITFSMLIFLSVWTSFVPAYLSTQGKYMVAVEVFGITSSSAGILFCIFLPKCYIILLRPELNTRGIF
ncbi:LOW QUALITY PROTEIN: extracellular calcium-sensing receptor-like [Rhinophrynus dorsalis]